MISGPTPSPSIKVAGIFEEESLLLMRYGVTTKGMDAEPPVRIPGFRTPIRFPPNVSGGVNSIRRDVGPRYRVGAADPFTIPTESALKPVPVIRTLTKDVVADTLAGVADVTVGIGFGAKEVNGIPCEDLTPFRTKMLPLTAPTGTTT
jgi:hypothetical protein